MPGTKLVLIVAPKGPINSTLFNQKSKTINMGFKSHIITFGVQARQPSLTSKENVFVK